MLLTESEIHHVVTQMKTAFPNFTAWEYNNESNKEYAGFSLWGQITLDAEDIILRRFFITLDTGEASWSGHLTIGQPYYFWSDADVGDAHLLDTEECKTAEEAIAALKQEILKLCRAFSVD